MAYILGLILAIGLVVFSFGSDISSDGFKNPLQQFREKTSGFSLPKAEREILVENIKADGETLQNFFSQNKEVILNSKSLSPELKNDFTKALEALENAGLEISELEKLKNNDLAASLVKKILKLEEKEVAEPTSIPPQCKLVCEK